MSAREHVLIIDHDAHRTETLKKNLTNNGYSVGSAENYKDALASIPDREPNLVLITTYLPDTTPSAISLVKIPGCYFCEILLRYRASHTCSKIKRAPYFK